MLSKRKNLLKNLIILCLTILICSGVHVVQVSALEYHRIEGLQPKQSGDFSYQYCETCQGMAIIKYTGTDKVVYVPKTIEGIQVKELAEYAFSENNTIEECVLPEGLISVGACAFSHCKNLLKVNIPEGIPYLSYTFSGCEALTSVSLPASLIRIDNGVFMGCKSLTNVVLPENVVGIAAGAFSECENLMEIQLPNRLKFIGERAFKGCKKLKEIEIPDSVLYINTEAFKGCSALRTITLPKKLYCLSAQVFMDCRALKEITLPSKVRYIEREAFYNCKRLKKIVFKGNALEIVYQDAFKGIHKKAVLDAPKKAVKKYKKLITKTSGYKKKTMKIK